MRHTIYSTFSLSFFVSPFLSCVFFFNLFAFLRSDAGLKHVLISQKVDKKAMKFRVASLPHNYTSQDQFEREQRMPIGKEWNTMTQFVQSIKPAVLTQQGAIIAPMTRQERYLKKFCLRFGITLQCFSCQFCWALFFSTRTQIMNKDKQTRKQKKATNKHKEMKMNASKGGGGARGLLMGGGGKPKRRGLS